MKYARNNALLDPFERWKKQRNDRFEKYKVLWGALFLSFGGLLFFALRRTKALWIGMGLSLILVVSAAGPRVIIGRSGFWPRCYRA